MKNKTLGIFLASLIILSLTTMVQAARNESMGNAVGAGTTAQGQQQVTTVPAKQPVVQAQNQVKTQNAGEDSRLMIETKEEVGTNKATNNIKNVAPRSEMAKEKMSNVATQVEELLTNKTMKGGIGEQVKQIATEQKMAQEQVKLHLTQVENRKGFMKSLIGPDFKALKDMEDQVEANQLRIEKLAELKTQLTNQSDITMVESSIQALIEQNTQLQETVSNENQSKSMFGWLFKYFAK